MTGLALANAIEANNHTVGDETTAGGVLQGKNNTTGDGAALIDLSETQNTNTTGGNQRFAPVNDNSSDHSRTENQFIFKD